MANIYIGNTIKKFALTKNKIYVQRPTDKIAELTAAGYTLAGYLFVPVAELPQAQKDILTPGTVIYQANAQLKGVA